MNKSFQESGGTVLSTNWSEVGKEKASSSDFLKPLNSSFVDPDPGYGWVGIILPDPELYPKSLMIKIDQRKLELLWIKDNLCIT
jgi:hypothetical protein